MDQSQKAITAEIKSLEDKFKQGDKPKIERALWLAGGVAAIGTAASVLYCPETLIEAVIPYASPLAQLLAGNAGLALMMGGGGYFFTKGEKEAKVALSKAFVKRIDGQLESLKEPIAGSKINFTFNIDSAVYPEYQKKTKEQVQDDIVPLNMAGYYVQIGSLFTNLFKEPVEKRPVVEKIDLKNAEMTDEQFQHLLSYGIGCCGTKTLDLSKNRLTFHSIQTLHSEVVEKKTTFGKLKSLNLSHNNLNSLSLEKISNIVRYLGIEELNLSDNNLNGSGTNVNEMDKNLKSFLENQPTNMPSLKVLKISNIGLTNNSSGTIKAMIKKPSVLMHLDITDHPHLNLKKLQSILNNAFDVNQSILEFKVDQPENLTIDALVQTKNSFYATMYSLSQQKGDKETPRFLYLLNRFNKNKSEKLDVKSCFDNELYNQLESISKDIMKKRIEAFGIQEDYSIIISEKEFILYKCGELGNFYEVAYHQKDMTDLDKRLFGGDEEKVKKPKNLEDNPYLLLSREQLEAEKFKLSDKVKRGLLRAF